MIELTKVELETLLKCVRTTERKSGECSDLDNVKFKIQSMIDNYCEHDLSSELIEQLIQANVLSKLK